MSPPQASGSGSNKENQPASHEQRYGSSKTSSSGLSNACRQNALELGPRKRPGTTDPLVHHGRHFGRTVYAFVNVYTLIINGLLAQDEDESEVPDTPEQRREVLVYQKMLKMVPGLEKRLEEASEEEVMAMAAMIQKGVNCARSDDTKSMKGSIIDWIIPADKTPLNPPLYRNVKMDRGFHHPRTGKLLCPVGLDWSSEGVQQQLRGKEITISGTSWPLFVYRKEHYDEDDPWGGLFRSHILLKAYKHVFTSPSSVEREAKATRSGNARLHGMTSVTRASVAYIATQVRFALSDVGVFNRADTETDSETFYHSVLDLLEDPEEQEEVKDLLTWWNLRIFPSFSTNRRTLAADSALARIKTRRARINAAASADAQGEAAPDVAEPAKNGE